MQVPFVPLSEESPSPDNSEDPQIFDVEDDESPRKRIPSRFGTLGLLWLCNVISFMDRTNISVAIIPMATEFGWSDSRKGTVLSSFFYGYITTQILGGYLANKYGGKST
jgi:MFS family permease